jgi:RNA polymerase sigma-70 factor, ECF subfamily
MADKPDKPEQPEQDGKLIDPDVELLKRVASGDDEAFRLLFERHNRLAYGVIYRQLGVQSIAEDLVQEAFLRVYRNAPKFEPTAKFTTWFYTIVTNLCLNYKRDRARDKLRLVSGKGEEAAIENMAEAEEPDHDALDAQERSRVVREAIDALPETQRMVLILSRFEDKSYDEIAEIMQTTVPAIKSLAMRARNQLKEKLAPFFGEE